MHQLHARRLSLVLTRTLRMVVGVHTEHAGVTGRRAPLWAKGSSMRTWQFLMSLDTYISERNLDEKHQAWLLRRLGSSAIGEIEMSPRGSKTLQPAVQQDIHHKWLTTGKMTQTNTWQEYCQYALQSASALLRDISLHFPEYSKSLQWLMRIRVGSVSNADGMLSRKHFHESLQINPCGIGVAGRFIH
ncbi:hypothetical protein GAYE_SCF37G5118 [Galdieria yellowstonensis]|uniref:Uncharacterized protein n=1 Tax=Galdieria yellowstonensis TaxID=3028027 RepID=A0AAV9IIZ6_9RHOD|nr:hypothetical protein GAYE_SCF37G5118 [Galdieria yellowstonensis]